MAGSPVLRGYVCIWNPIGPVPMVEGEEVFLVQEDSISAREYYEEAFLCDADDLDIVCPALRRADESRDLLSA